MKNYKGYIIGNNIQMNTINSKSSTIVIQQNQDAIVIVGMEDIKKLHSFLSQVIDGQ